MLKSIVLSPKVYVRLLKGNFELYSRDLEDSIKGIQPGEWVIFKCEKNYQFLGHLNPHVTNDIIGRVLAWFSDSIDDVEPEKYLIEKISNAIDYRFRIDGFSDGCRLIHGQADGLTGLICDLYKNEAILQINTAGMDKYRSLIVENIRAKIDRPVFLLNNLDYRKHEVLPEMEGDSEFPSCINVLENGFEYQIDSKVMQKIGYYYDHRDNRIKLLNYLKKVNRKLSTGVDLFCYVGSWGLHLLKAGIQHVDFVDQGNFEQTIFENLRLNNFEKDRASFFREDVFKYLDSKIKENVTFDIVVSDPPAFKKKEQNKAKALGGYKKLHGKALQVVTRGGLLVVASCTSNISLEELDQTVVEVAIAQERKLRVLDIGIQGNDHPFSSFNDKGNYIKYILYYVD